MENLPEQTRNQIRLEEFYRAEIRDQVTMKERQKQSELGRFLLFLNSSFGLWLLSAVFITGAGSLYTKWHTAQDEKQKQQAQLRTDAEKKKEIEARLQLEIGHRVSETVVLLWKLCDPRDPSRLGAGHSPGEVRTVVASMQNGNGQKLFSRYPEFDNLNTLSLLTELRRLEPEQDKDRLDRAITDISGLDVLLDVEKASFSNPKSVAGAILKRFSSILWGKFYFIDCSPESPFC